MSSTGVAGADFKVKTHLVLCAVFVAGGFFSSGCSRSEPLAKAVALPALPAQVVAARAEERPVLTPSTGTVRPLRRAIVGAKVSGVIEQLPVALGQRVEAGDLLAQLAASDLAARVTQARTQREQARRDLERDTRLAEGGATTEDAVRVGRDRVALAEAALHEAETTLGYATLRAPFAGVISRRLVYAGDLATAGQPLVEIEGTDAFEVEVAVPDSLAAALRVGTAVRVELPFPDEAFEGRVTELSSAADAAARSVLAKIGVPANAKVRSGQFARVLLPGPPVRQVLVPATAVTRFGQMERVFVVSSDQRATLRLVKTGGAIEGGWIEIVSGLDAGERVVAPAIAGLRDGQQLTLAP